MIIRHSFFYSWVILSVTMTGVSFARSEGIQAVTRPSQDVTLSFVHAGCIAEVLVKEGDAVSAGASLVKQGDAAEQVKLAQLHAQAQDTIRVQSQQAQLDQKKVELEKIEWAQGRGAATDIEVRKAGLDVQIARLSLELARFEHQQDAREYEQAIIGVERMTLVSPIGGKIEKLFIETGESVRELDEVIRVVNTDPLWIDVPVTLDDSWQLKTGGSARIEFTGRNPAKSKGRIIHIAAVADAASNTRTVRVEVPNKSDRPAGEHITVSFDEPAESSDVGKGRQILDISAINDKDTDKE